MVPVLLAVVAVVALVVWFDARCLSDLARTDDAELRTFPRNVWAMVIVFAFPIGAMLYLRYGKGGPRRFS